MNLNFRKSVLFFGAAAMLGTYSAPAFAVAPGTSVEVQQQKKISGTVADADGPIIGASVLEKVQVTVPLQI